MAHQYAANQHAAFLSAALFSALKLHLVQLLKLTLELARARIQRLSVSAEAVQVVLLGNVTLQITGLHTVQSKNILELRSSQPLATCSYRGRHVRMWSWKDEQLQKVW